MGRLRESAVATVYGVMRPLAPRVPRRVFYGGATLVGWANYALHGALRAAVRANMRRVYSGLLSDAAIEREVRGYFAERAKFVFESLLVPHLHEPRYASWFEIRGREIVERLVAEKRGVVIPLIHYGPFTLAGALLAHWGLAVTDIAQGLDEAPSSAAAQRMNRDRYASWQASGGGIVERSGFLRGALAALKRGEGLSVFFDAPPTATSVMIEAWFVGRWITLHRGPATVALKTGSPLLLMAAHRGAGNRIHVDIERVIEVRRSGDKEADIRATLQEVADYMSAWVHRHPAQWIMWKELHERDRPAPPGAEAARRPSAPETTLPARDR